MIFLRIIILALSLTISASSGPRCTEWVVESVDVTLENYTEKHELILYCPVDGTYVEVVAYRHPLSSTVGMEEGYILYDSLDLPWGHIEDDLIWIRDGDLLTVD